MEINSLSRSCSPSCSRSLSRSCSLSFSLSVSRSLPVSRAPLSLSFSFSRSSRRRFFPFGPPAATLPEEEEEGAEPTDENYEEVFEAVRTAKRAEHGVEAGSKRGDHFRITLRVPPKTKGLTAEQPFSGFQGIAQSQDAKMFCTVYLPGEDQTVFFGIAKYGERGRHRCWFTSGTGESPSSSV